MPIAYGSRILGPGAASGTCNRFLEMEFIYTLQAALCWCVNVTDLSSGYFVGYSESSVESVSLSRAEQPVRSSHALFQEGQQAP